MYVKLKIAYFYIWNYINLFLLYKALLIVYNTF